MQVSCKVAVLCRIPVVSRKIMTGSLVGRATRRSPILILRIVEAELHALLAALFGQFADRIPMKGCGCDDIKRIGLGIEHGKAVMMLGGDDDVFHAGRLGEGNNVMGIESS